MTTLLDVCSELNNLENEENKLRRSFDADMEKIRKRTKALTTERNYFKAGLDPLKIQQARCVLEIQGKPNTIERVNLVKEAINKLLNPESLNQMRKEYLGLKNYSGFGDQRHDGPYGTGPRHGSIVFSVGLTPAIRNCAITDEEREAAIYYLLNLETIQAAQEQN